jgi:hypothetical protein
MWIGGRRYVYSTGQLIFAVVFYLPRLFRSGPQQSFGYRSGCVFCKRGDALPLLHTLLAHVSVESESTGARNSWSRQDLRTNPGIQISDSPGMASNYNTCPWALGCMSFA